MSFWAFTLSLFLFQGNANCVDFNFDGRSFCITNSFIKCCISDLRFWAFVLSLFFSKVMPIVLTSILMGAVFALPIESGEKMGFSLTVLLSYVVFLTWVTDNLPPVSTDISVLREYLKKAKDSNNQYIIFFLLKMCFYICLSQLMMNFWIL